jgi:sugar lactone lactonase YvrE
MLGSADGTGAAAQFLYPNGIATDTSGNVYVADTDNCTIRKITPAGLVTTLAGRARVTGSADGSGTAALFNSPNGIATDTSGNVYVADTFNHTIRKITSAGVVTTVAGTAGVASFVAGSVPGIIAYPQGVAVSGNKIYITTINGVVVVTN